MNLNLILKLIGRVLLIEGAALVLPCGIAALYQEDLAPFLYSIFILIGCGTALSFLPSKRQLFAWEGFCTVGLIWIITCFVGALPFFFSGEFPSFVDCLFESCSGFTTTGATILTEIEHLPRGILFWRSLTHWLGGMGVLVLATAVFPSIGVRSRSLIQAESPGPVFSKLVPRQTQASKILYSIYCVLTLFEIVCLKLAGMPLYDAFLHAFSSAGTGGFSNRNASIGAYESVAIEGIITVFILLFSINFSLYFLILTRRIREALHSDEFHFFLYLTIGASLLITWNTFSVYGSFTESLRYAVFQVASILSTTGFSTADYVVWPQFSQMILVFLMFCGACAGSTGGGMKCSRILLLLRSIRREIHQIIHPHEVKVVKLDGQTVPEETLRSILVFTGTYILIVLITAGIVSLDNFSFSVSFSASLTCLSNVGPGLELIGPSGSFAVFSDLSKIVLSLCMIIGRLEIFPILLLLSRPS